MIELDKEAMDASTTTHSTGMEAEQEIETIDRAIESTQNRIFYLMKNNVDGESVKKNRQCDVQDYILKLLKSRRDVLISQGALR